MDQKIGKPLGGELEPTGNLLRRALAGRDAPAAFREHLLHELVESRTVAATGRPRSLPGTRAGRPEEQVWN
jgi:hypothetical protein